MYGCTFLKLYYTSSSHQGYQNDYFVQLCLIFKTKHKYSQAICAPPRTKVIKIIILYDCFWSRRSNKNIGSLSVLRLGLDLNVLGQVSECLSTLLFFLSEGRINVPLFNDVW